MLWIIAVALVGLWVFGLLNGVAHGAFINVLLVAAMVLVLVRLARGPSVT
jgi:Family of unknown function (DUF5670)